MITLFRKQKQISDKLIIDISSSREKKTNIVTKQNTINPPAIPPCRLPIAIFPIQT